jgi:hypothetical protein
VPEKIELELPPTTGSYEHRWKLIAEIANIPATSDYDVFRNKMAKTNLKAIRNAQKLLDQWSVSGWKAKTKSQKWDYAGAFTENGGSANFVNSNGQKIAHMIEILETASKQPLFDDVFEEVFLSIQNIRIFIYQHRWKNYSQALIKGDDIQCDTATEKGSIIIDIFRTLCLDYLARNETLTREKIAIIWTVFKSPTKYSVLDIKSFRNTVDSLCSKFDSSDLNLEYPLRFSNEKGYYLKFNYPFHEFEEYSGTFNKRLVKGLNGSFKLGFASELNLKSVVNKIIK